MNLPSFPFTTFEWSTLPAEEHRGITGIATWKILQLGDIRIRQVRYSAGYTADHWCSKGHILYCIEGEMRTILKDGRSFILSPGISYMVGDNNEPHRSETADGCLLFIVD